MTLVIQIVVAVIVLVGLITVIMSVKNWHWAQMLLVLGIFLLSVTNLLFGLEVYRIHSTIRAKLPLLERDLADIEAENNAMLYGSGDILMERRVLTERMFDIEAEGRLPSLAVWGRRLQELERRRGNVWRGVTPAGPVDAATNRIPVQIPAPQPHGLDQNTIVYAFEEGEPSAAAPQEGAQYLGEFRVVESRPDGVMLESVYRLDNRTGNRLASSGRPWILYERIPTDQYELFADLTEEELRQQLPAATVEEYIRHGSPATPDDDELHRAAFDDQDHRLGPEAAGDVAEWRYDRLLRDYDYLFDAANRQLTERNVRRAALAEDIKKLGEALANAKKVGDMRTAEKQGLTADVGHLEQEVETIGGLLATIQRQLANARQEITSRIAQNLEMADQLRQSQLGALFTGNGDGLRSAQ